MNDEVSRVWVFCGEGSTVPSGVFDDLSEAESWIARHELSGLLTAYPLNQGVYEWAIAAKVFEPTTPAHRRAKWIQTFSSAHLEHYHFSRGKRASDNSFNG